MKSHTPEPDDPGITNAAEFLELIGTAAIAADNRMILEIVTTLSAALLCAQKAPALLDRLARLEERQDLLDAIVGKAEIGQVCLAIHGKALH